MNKVYLLLVLVNDRALVEALRAKAGRRRWAISQLTREARRRA
jgi:hypothetical protein